MKCPPLPSTRGRNFLKAVPFFIGCFVRPEQSFLATGLAGWSLPWDPRRYFCSFKLISFCNKLKAHGSRRRRGKYCHRAWLWNHGWRFIASLGCNLIADLKQITHLSETSYWNVTFLEHWRCLGKGGEVGWGGGGSLEIRTLGKRTPMPTLCYPQLTLVLLSVFYFWIACKYCTVIGYFWGKQISREQVPWIKIKKNFK